MSAINDEHLAIVQIAYYVQDLDEAIERWHANFGLGPFIVNRHMKPRRSIYRGTPMSLDISAAFVQSGEIQIELLCQHNPEPSAFRDMFPNDEEGLHHVAVFPENYARLLSHYQARGFEIATEIEVGTALGAAFIDTRALLGHMLEVYRDNGSIRSFYSLVEDAAKNWDGHSLTIDVRELSSYLQQRQSRTTNPG